MSLRVSFDTSVLIDWHKRPTDKSAELTALKTIFELKQSDSGHRWYFMYLDMVRREYGGRNLDKLIRETEIQDILPYFDQVVSLSRGPMILPVIVVGEEHGEAVRFFESVAISRADSQVLADAVYMKSDFLVTTDMRIARNKNAVSLAQTIYGLTIVSPLEYLASSAVT